MGFGARFGSLDRQLPLAAAAFFITIASALTVLAHSEVVGLARELAAVRLHRVTELLAGSSGLSVARTRARLSIAAAHPAVVGLLLRTAAGDSQAARGALAPLAGQSDSSVVVGLWNLAGDPVLIAVTRGDTARWVGAPSLVDSTTVTPVLAADDSTLFYSFVAPVRSNRHLIGFVQRRQRFRSTTQTGQTVTTLVGGEGKLLLGSAAGVWMDLSTARRVDPPDPTAFGATEPVAYRRDGARQIGIGRPIAGASWIMFAELPESDALAPTRGFLARVGLIALVLVAATTLAAGVLGRRITRPLGDLRQAAEAMGAGVYGRRVTVSGHPEIELVAEAFNGMAVETDRHINALRESEERFRSLVTATSQIVWWTDAQGNVVDALPSWQAFTGQSFQDAKGAGWTGAVHPDDAAAALQVWRHAVEHRSLFETEYRIRRHDGEYRWFVARGVPVLNADGSIREWVSTCTDITGRREAEDKLRRKEAELRQAQRLDAVGRLAGGIAHDFNNLLTAIVAPAELAASQLPPDHPVSEDLNDIRGAALRAGELTRQLLAFGRQQVMSPEVLDVNEVVRATGRLLQRVIGESISMKLALSPDAMKVKVDRTQLEQVIVNLAVNARDAMPEGGNLTIETCKVELTEAFSDRHAGVRPGRYVLLMVTDTGTGMNEDIKSHLFEPFFTTKDHGKGTGLGLSTAYGIVRQSGGHIWVYSEVGEGSVFKVYFPEAVEGLAEQRPPVKAAAVPTGSETILLAEDEPALLALGARILGRLGYTVLPAANGDAALTLARDHRGMIDLLVSDVVMPGMNGIELWERVRMDSPALPALFLSGWASDAVVRHGILEGQVPFLQKPFTTDQLGWKVREVLDRVPGARYQVPGAGSEVAGP